MGRPPTRASGVKALQAIKESSGVGRTKKVSVNSENPSCQPVGVKRSSSPGSIVLPSAKRNALGDVTNAGVRVSVPASKPAGVRKSDRQQSLKKTKEISKTVKLEPDLDVSLEALQTSTLPKDTPVTQVQNFLKATTLHDLSLQSEETLSSPEASSQEPPTQLWRDIDQAEAKDPLFSAQYAPYIYAYMRQREEHFAVAPYMERQGDIHAQMRTILVDWLIEVQENFELFHETLYLAVKIVDLYLSKKDVKREYLQLVGATSMLLAAKFEELTPPLVDDFLYLCDDAYTHDELLKMEQDIFKTVHYDINIPVAYRFLRRLAKAAEATMETHTLARYISESTLQDYQFVVEKPSMVAAASMYLALRMKSLGGWNPTLQHYSGYTVEQMLPFVTRLNTLIQTPLGNTCTVRSKYSHDVFFNVATTPALQDVTMDAEKALAECPTVVESS
ncbi:G2/mitotic-specific cyclin-B3-like isoform X2 [Halichondria panicea]|uniref:G2/mitotic-specific cyclin-B3-like isoform X2 n=1 Tax=Halichondria panicea TaxID=6063 RepID=UPI00312B7F96